MLIHQKQRNKPCFRSLIFFLNNILPILHPFNMLVIVLFHLCPHELLKVGILIPFSISVILSKTTHLLFVMAFDSCLSISLHCVSTIVCTFMDCCTTTCTSMDGYTFTSMMLSSSTFVYTIYASTKCYSISLFSSNSWMNIGSTNVVIGHVCSLVREHLLLLCRNSIMDVQVVFMS